MHLYPCAISSNRYDPWMAWHDLYDSYDPYRSWNNGSRVVQLVTCIDIYILMTSTTQNTTNTLCSPKVPLMICTSQTARVVNHCSTTSTTRRMERVVKQWFTSRTVCEMYIIRETYGVYISPRLVRAVRLVRVVLKEYANMRVVSVRVYWTT